MTRSTRKRLLVAVTVLTAAAVAVIVLAAVTAGESADFWRGFLAAAPVFGVPLVIAMAWENFNLRSERKTTA